jgi:hypothetical protein
MFSVPEASLVEKVGFAHWPPEDPPVVVGVVDVVVVVAELLHLSDPSDALVCLKTSWAPEQVALWDCPEVS